MSNKIHIAVIVVSLVYTRTIIVASFWTVSSLSVYVNPSIRNDRAYSITERSSPWYKRNMRR